uniref:Uncharacterized protein n=1 Tax=Micrurus spixii TaxID=129469 RepID=A0A2D4N649_9SAUR
MGEVTNSLEFGEGKNLAQIIMRSKPLGETETTLNIAHPYYCPGCRLCPAASQHVQPFKGFGLCQSAFKCTICFSRCIEQTPVHTGFCSVSGSNWESHQLSLAQFLGAEG